jgi:ribosomal protein S18 acetylase RimI-like enzyme
MKKVTITRIDPAKDLVDVWRLLKSSLTLEKWEHPSLSRVHEEDMQAYLSRYMLQTPTFFGMIARLGKRPVALVMGSGNVHFVGAPETYFFVHTVWVEPEFRGAHVMNDLWTEFLAEIKKLGYWFWEANSFSKFTPRLLKSKHLKIRKLYTRIGGSI